MNVAKDVNLDQLAAELEAKLGHRVPVEARHDPETLKPTAVDAEVDDAVLAEAVEEHVAVWPPPPPDPIDAMRDAVKAASADAKIAALLEHLDPILRVLRERSAP